MGLRFTNNKNGDKLIQYHFIISIKQYIHQHSIQSLSFAYPKINETSVHCLCSSSIDDLDDLAVTIYVCNLYASVEL